MVRYFPALFFVALCCIASDVVRYNPASSPITNRVTAYVSSVDTLQYIGLPGHLIITNRAAQSGPGVTASNLTAWCVVDGGWVRLMTQAEVDEIAATNAILAALAVEQAKLDARITATNVVTGVDGTSLFLRSLAEANWFFINQIRTNLGYSALTKGAYLNAINGYIDSFGQ